MSVNINRYALYQNQGTCWYFAPLNAMMVSPYTRKFMELDLKIYLNALQPSERSEIETDFAPGQCSSHPSTHVFYRFIWNMLHPKRRVKRTFSPSSRMFTRNLLRAHHSANVNLSVGGHTYEEFKKLINKTKYLSRITKFVETGVYNRNQIVTTPITVLFRPSLNSNNIDNLRFMIINLVRRGGGRMHNSHFISLVILNGIPYMIDSNGFKGRWSFDRPVTENERYNAFCMNTYGFTFDYSSVTYAVYTQDKYTYKRPNPKSIITRTMKNKIAYKTKSSTIARQTLLKKLRSRPSASRVKSAATKIQTVVRGTLARKSFTKTKTPSPPKGVTRKPL